MTDKEELLKSYKEYIEQIKLPLMSSNEDNDDVIKLVEQIWGLTSSERKTDNDNEREV